MSILDIFEKKAAEKQPDGTTWITAEEMKDICPSCAEAMAKKGMTKVAVSAMVNAILEEDLKVEAKGPGNIQELIKYWKSKEHPFGACKKWVSEHKGEPKVSDSDKFCGKMKHMVED
jgi:hypothetical protein